MVTKFETCICVTLTILIILSIYAIYIVHNPPIYITKKFSHCIKGEKGDKGDKGENGEKVDNCFQPLVASYLELTESVMYRNI